LLSHQGQRVKPTFIGEGVRDARARPPQPDSLFYFQDDVVGERFQAPDAFYLHPGFHLGFHQNTALDTGELKGATEEGHRDIIQVLRAFIQSEGEALTRTRPDERGKVYLNHRKTKVPGTSSGPVGLRRREFAESIGKVPGTGSFNCLLC
jgi:hypothetical protein